jgi:hypothetical protein
MTVTLYQSSDAGAPSLTGQAGSLITLLDALLVNGYNSGSVTSITRSGSTATATRTGHGFKNGDHVLHAGADQPEYNGEFYISNVTADTYDFTVSGTPVTPATGTITAKRAPAGWTKAYSGVNKAAYRQGGGNQFYLRIVDDGTGAATYARGVGYETMSDVDTGTGDFPTAAQFSGGLYWYKSSTADAAARPWTAVATNKFFILYVNVDGGGLSSNSAAFAFGDINSYSTSDAYHTIHIAATSTTETSNGNLHKLSTSGITGHYMARSYTQLGTSINVGKTSDTAKGNSANMGAGGLTYPHPVDGGLYLAPVWVMESASVVRGVIPGLWNPLHTKPLNNGDTFVGVGGLAGKSFMALTIFNYQIIIETSNTWG